MGNMVTDVYEKSNYDWLTSVGRFLKSDNNKNNNNHNNSNEQKNNVHVAVRDPFPGQTN